MLTPLRQLPDNRARDSLQPQHLRFQRLPAPGVRIAQAQLQGAPSQKYHELHQEEEYQLHQGAGGQPKGGAEGQSAQVAQEGSFADPAHEHELRAAEKPGGSGLSDQDNNE